MGMEGMILSRDGEMVWAWWGGGGWWVTLDRGGGGGVGVCGGVTRRAKTTFQRRAISPQDGGAEAVQPLPPFYSPDISFPQYRLCACASILTLVV